jgi:hypothetical protein
VSNAARAALIAVGLILAAALFLFLRPDETDDAAGTTVATSPVPPDGTVPTTAPLETEPPPTQPPPTQTRPEPTAVNARIEVVGGRPAGGRPKRLRVTQGRTLLLTVTSDVADEVHVHGYDIARPVSPGRPTRIRFVASTTGRFEIELEQSHVLLAELEVRP